MPSRERERCENSLQKPRRRLLLREDYIVVCAVRDQSALIENLCKIMRARDMAVVARASPLYVCMGINGSRDIERLLLSTFEDCIVHFGNISKTCTFDLFVPSGD